MPAPKAQTGKPTQLRLALGEKELSTAEQQYNPYPVINTIRQEVDRWRALPERQWKVTPETARLLRHWRGHPFSNLRPFFCQIEAAETAIWLVEVAGALRDSGTNLPSRWRGIWNHLHDANASANPELVRLALKMATGAGKTTVMAMLIAWQTVNAVRRPGRRNFTRGFLVVTPGITIRDRLRVLLPEDPDSYYGSRELVPRDMLPDVKRACVVITNYHAFQRRERLKLAKGTRALLRGRGEAPSTIETEGEMLRRVMAPLMGLKSILVLNDEGHHCYREKVGVSEEADLKGDDSEEAKKNAEAARVWISGIETVKKTIAVPVVFDLSATPFFLRGSGYAEGTLFPWTVSDFSLMDAIESGIVKLPRVPVSDNVLPTDMPRLRNLWEHIGKDMPKKGRRRAGALDPEFLPPLLETAVDALYSHYEKTFAQWRDVGIETPPVFIVVCNNTATSKLLYDYLSGYRGPGADGSPGTLAWRARSLPQLRRNGNPPPTAPDAIDRQRADRVRRRPRQDLPGGREGPDRAFPPGHRGPRRQPAGSGGGHRLGPAARGDEHRRQTRPKLGEHIRCVVSVAMLTEGWDASTVTHILGVRAFGTQLLCEQVVGRALRRQSYDLNPDGRFDPEYADVLGVPFDFTAKPTVIPPIEASEGDARPRRAPRAGRARDPFSPCRRLPGGTPGRTSDRRLQRRTPP